jgi:hypothetical protein
VVVAVGLTVVEPLAEVDVNVPGVIASVAAPVVSQLSVPLEPKAILAGFAEKEVIVGLLGGFAVTVTVTLDVAELVALVAVSV